MMDDIKQRNITGTRYSFLGRITSSVILFVLSIIVARYLGPDAYGELSLALTIIIFSSVVIDAGFNRSTQKHISQYLKDDSSSVKIAYKKMLSIKIASAIVAIVLLYATSDIFSSIFNSIILGNLLKLGSVLLAATILLEFNLVILQGYEDFKNISKVNVLEAGSKFLITLLIIYMGMDVVDILGGYSLSGLIVSLVLTITVYFLIKPVEIHEKISKDLTKEIVNYSPPIFLSILFFVIYTKFDIVALGYFGKITDVGYYSLAVGLIDNLLIPLVAIETTVMPIAASLFGKDQNKADMNALFNQTMVNGFFFMIPTIAGLIVVSFTFIKEVYGETFLDSAFILIALTPFMLTKTLAVLNGAYLIGANKAKIFMKYTFGAMILNIVLLVLLIPEFGVYGAVASKIISHSVLTFAMLSYIFRNFELALGKDTSKSCVKIIFSSLMMAILSYLILQVSGGGLIGLILTIPSGVVLYIVFLYLTKTLSLKEMIKIAHGDMKLKEI